MGSVRYTKKERARLTDEARSKLKELLQCSTVSGVGTIYTEVTHVSSSGMSRDVRCMLVDFNGHIEDVTFWVAHAIGELPREDKRGARCIRVGGCGFNVGLHVADALKYALYGRDGVLQQGNFEPRDGKRPNLIWREL